MRILPAFALTLLLPACSGTDTIQGPVPQPASTVSPAPIQRITGINGRLVRSPDGLISVVDGPNPEGFTVLAGATVRLLGTDQSATADPTGYFELREAPAGLQRIQVEDRILLVPSFSAEAGPPTSLTLFPPRLALVGNQTLAVRAVGRDAHGRFAPLESVSYELDLVDANPPEPDTSPLQAREVVGNVPPGLYQVVARAQGVSGRAELVMADAGDTGALQGQTAPNATVQVGGSPLSTTADSQGNFLLTGLPPVVTPVFAWSQGQLAATGMVGIQSDRLTTRALPPLNQGYTPAGQFPVASPSGLFVDGKDQVLVCNQTEVLVFTADGQPVPPPIGTRFSNARGVAASFNGTKLVADSGSGQLHILPESGQGDQTFRINDPIGVATDAAGSVYCTSYTGDTIHKLVAGKDGQFSPGAVFGESYLEGPAGLAIDRLGKVFVADRGDNEVEVFSVGGTHLNHWTLEEEPRQVAVDAAGNVYVLGPTQVHRFDNEGVHIGNFGQFDDATGLAVGPAGNVYVSDGPRVLKFSPHSPPTLPPPAFPPPTGGSLVQNASFEAMESSLQSLMQELEIPGGSLSITVNGRLIVNRAYGYATQSLEQTIPVQPGNPFRLASCSKSFAAVTLLHQLQAGLWSLGDPVFAPGGELAAFAPSLFDPRMAAITGQMLLQMTAGLNDTSGLYSPLARTLSATPPASAAQILTHILTATKLSFDPGNQYEYSDMAYLAVGRLVEAVEGTGESYGQILSRRLLGPIGADSVRVSSTELDGAAPGEVSYYGFAGETGGQSVFTNDPLTVPATYGAVWDGRAHDSCGGLISSTEDMTRLMNSVAPDGPPGFPRPLDEATVAQMVGAPPVQAQGQHYFGMGWDVTVDDQGNFLGMAKDGALPGTMTFMQYSADGRIAYAIAFNSRPGPATANSTFAMSKLRDAVTTFIGAQATWPDGDLSN